MTLERGIGKLGDYRVGHRNTVKLALSRLFSDRVVYEPVPAKGTFPEEHRFTVSLTPRRIPAPKPLTKQHVAEISSLGYTTGRPVKPLSQHEHFFVLFKGKPVALVVHRPGKVVIRGHDLRALSTFVSLLRMHRRTFGNLG